MNSDVRAKVAAGAAVLIVAAVSLWGWSVLPERAGRWLLTAAALPIFWAFLEFAQGGTKHQPIMNWHRWVIASVGLALAVQYGFGLAIASGMLDADWQPFARRASGILKGVLLALWGNYLPKLLSPWSAEEEWFDWQRVHRFAGWIATLSGIGLVLVWMTLPLALARPATVGILIAFAVMGVGRKFISVAEYSRRRPPAPPLESTSDRWQG